MKREKKLVEYRRAQIMEILRERGEISVEELAVRFETSSMTIRRDLQILEEKGNIERFYGGARLPELEKPLTEEEELLLYRDLIANLAAGFVKENDSIFINGSSTALGLLRHLGNKQVQVVTNNGKSVNIPYSKSIQVFLTGGRIHNTSGILVGDNAMRTLLSTYTDKAFLGFAGVSENGEVACDIPAEIGINELMADHCKELYVLTDHTKLGKTSNFASCSLEQKWTLITDEKADSKLIQRLRDQGMTVYQVSMRDRTYVKTIAPAGTDVQ